MNTMKKTQMQSQPAMSTLSAVAGLVVALSLSSNALAASKTYTFDPDFDLGLLSGVNHTAPNNHQLQLSVIGTTFPVMWIANAGEDTVSKFDTTANVEIARYRTYFGGVGAVNTRGIHGAYSGPAPSRTAVDLSGNAFVLNRFFENKKPVLIKILAEGFIDRNSNGVMDTSSGPTPLLMSDLNGNDKIDPNEITDERIAWAVEVGSQNGLGRSLCIGTDGNLWVGMYNAQTYYKVSAVDGSQIAGPVSVPWTPYGCLIDKSGTLWSASLGGTLGRIDGTSSNSGPYPVSAIGNMSNYGIALGSGKVYVGSGNRVYDPVTNASAAIPNMTVSSNGIVVDGSNSIIAGNSAIRKVSSAGALEWQAPLQAGGSFAVGIQVDSNNDVWQIGFTAAGRMQKYRGSDGAPLGTFPVGNMPYTYSDAAGFAARNSTIPSGTWTVKFDSGAAGTAWGKINWTDLVPAGALIEVQARTADNEADLPIKAYQPISKGVQFAALGRHIQILTTLKANTNNDSPILFDLSVNSLVSTCDVDLDGDVDTADLRLIRAGIGQVPVANDPRDGNGDGKIDARDVRACTFKCTRASCAIN
ncbi:hypothetical protein [Roseateles sp.]|uniref:hypothetical protein n=1 Tax=Roseateles sp. TaxID=1971397 RepID=UPI00286A8858|nr:hypothetical protein [Roseateles sp.]